MVFCTKLFGKHHENNTSVLCSGIEKEILECFNAEKFQSPTQSTFWISRSNWKLRPPTTPPPKTNSETPPLNKRGNCCGVTLNHSKCPHPRGTSTDSCALGYGTVLPDAKSNDSREPIVPVSESRKRQKLTPVTIFNRVLQYKTALLNHQGRVRAVVLSSQYWETSEYFLTSLTVGIRFWTSLRLLQNAFNQLSAFFNEFDHSLHPRINIVSGLAEKSFGFLRWRYQCYKDSEHRKCQYR